MQRVTLDELRRSPVGHYVAGDKFIHFCATPALWGVILWGRPAKQEALLLGRSLVLELEAPAVPHASIVDATRLSGADVGAFRALERYLVHFAEPLSRQVTRLALVRPGGLDGALVSGVFDVVPRPYPVQVCDAVTDALGWLARGADLGASVAALAQAMAGAFAEADSTPPLLGELRALLDRNMRRITLPEAAALLKVSERTLQRRLTEAGTSFSNELGEARLRAATAMLRESDLPVTTIALEVGCASLQHFDALFRSRYGQSPSVWRKRSQ